VSHLSQRPAASPFARWQAAEGEPPTNRRHEAVWIERLDAQILALLDGSRDHSQLLDALIESVRSGRLDIIEQNQRVRGLEYIKPLLAATLADSLPRLAQHALLVS
jgi:methyltransferase-like protein